MTCRATRFTPRSSRSTSEAEGLERLRLRVRRCTIDHLIHRRHAVVGNEEQGGAIHQTALLQPLEEPSELRILVGSRFAETSPRFSPD